MGTLVIHVDEAVGDKVAELIRDQIANIKSGAVTGFDWDAETEIELFEDALTAIDDARTDLAGR